MNSRSASSAPAAWASERPAPTAPARVGRSLPEGGHPAGGQDHRSREHAEGIAAPRPGDKADAAALGADQRARRARLEHRDPLVHRCERRELTRDAPPGCGAARVHDAPARMPALEPEREVAVAVGVEVHAEPPEVTHALGRLLAQHLHRAGACGVAARCQRVGGVQVGRVVVGQSSRDPALGPVGGGLRQWRAADEGHAGALSGRGECGVETGRAGADDGDVDPQRLGLGLIGHAPRVRYRRQCPCSSATRPRSSTKPATATPSGSTGCTPSMPSSSAATGSDSSVARPPRRPRSSLWRFIRPSTSRPCARRAREAGPSISTPLPPRAPGKPPCTPPAAPARWRRP